MGPRGFSGIERDRSGELQPVALVYSSQLFAASLDRRLLVVVFSELVEINSARFGIARVDARRGNILVAALGPSVFWRTAFWLTHRFCKQRSQLDPTSAFR